MIRQGFFIVLQIVASLMLMLFGADASSAFMQGGADPLTSGAQWFYVWQPRNLIGMETLPGMQKGQIIELVGSAYGKVNAPRLWYRVVARFLLWTGWVQHSFDCCFFMLYCEKSAELIGVIGIHVDDLIGGVKYEWVPGKLEERFTWGSFKWHDLVFCGKHFVQNLKARTIQVDQRSFCEAIEVTTMPRERRK